MLPNNKASGAINASPQQVSNNGFVTVAHNPTGNGGPIYPGSDPITRMLELYSKYPNQYPRQAISPVGYKATFWEDPIRVARWHNAVSSAPKGWTPPNWLDVDKLALAYNYFSVRNNGTPWTEWKYLNAQDPGRKVLQSFQLPPNDYMWPQDGQSKQVTIDAVRNGEIQWSTLADDQRKEILTDPNFDMEKWDYRVRGEILADPYFDWSRVPPSQKLYYNAVSSPYVMASPMALAGQNVGKVLGPLGQVAGGFIGYGLGVIGGKEYDQTKGVFQQPTAAAGLMALLNRLSEYSEQVKGFAGQVLDATLAGKFDAAQQMITDSSTRRAAWEAARSTYEVSGFGRYESNLMALVNPFLSKELYQVYGLLAQGKIAEAEHVAAEYLNKNPMAGPGEDFIIGKATPVPAYKVLGHDPITGKEKYYTDSMGVMMDWRHTIDAAIESGATEEEIDGLTNQMLAEVSQFIGAQAFDLTGQSIFDPLNQSGKITSLLGEGTFKSLAKAAGLDTPNGKAFSAMADAFSQTEGIFDAKRRYETIMRFMPLDEIRSMDGFAGNFMRNQAGLTPEGKISAGPFTTRALLDPGTRHTAARGFVDWLTQLTPESKARVGLGLAYDNLRTIFSQFDNPADIAKLWNSIKNGDIETAKSMAGNLVNAPEWATILPAIKDFDKMPDLLAVWEVSADKRALLLRVAQLMGIEPSKLVDSLGKNADTQRMYQMFHDKLEAMDSTQAKAMLDDMKSGAFTPDDMKSIADIFNGEEAIPWHPDQWQAMVSDAIGDHFGEWAKANLGLRPDSPFFRLAATMKAAQSLLLLGFNPNYLVNNMINNIVTRAATGLYGFMTPAQIKSWMDRFGVQPYRMSAGVGAIGESFDTLAGERAITDATRDSGIISRTQRVLKETSQKVGIFSRMSQEVEMLESRQAFAISMREMWGRLWRRGYGFSKMDPTLVNALKAIHPDAPDLIYSAVEAGMNRAEIEGQIYGQQRAIYSREYIHNAATKTGLAPQMVGMMMEKLGVLDRLDTELQKARTPEQIHNAFRTVDRYAQDQITRVRAQELPTRMVEVANRVEAEGPAAAMDIVADTISRNTDTWLDHYVTFGDVFEKIDQIPEAGMRSRLLRDARKININRWSKANDWEITTYNGLMEALRWDKSPEIIEFMRQLEDVNRIKGDTYKAQFDAVDAWERKWTGQWDNPARWDEWTAMQAQFDKDFSKMFRAEHDSMITQGLAMGGFIEKTYGKPVGDAFNKGWADVVRFRDAMVGTVRKFREDAARMSYDDRMKAKAQFYQHKYPAMIVQFGNIRKMFGEDLQAAIQGKSPRPGGTGGESVTPSVKPVTPPETPGTSGGKAVEPPVEPVQADIFSKKAAEEVARYDAEIQAEEADIWKAAVQHGFTGVDEAGNFNPNSKLDLIKLVKKYGGERGAHIRKFTDITPELVDKSFANREERARAQNELWNSTLDTTPIEPTQPVETTAPIEPIPAPVQLPKGEALRQVYVGEHPDRTPNTMQDFTDRYKEFQEPLGNSLIEIQEAIRESSAKPTDILQAIKKKGGISLKERPDITPEKRNIPGLFTRNGMPIDWIVTALEEDGYLTKADIDNLMDNGGINRARELIGKALAGEKIYPYGEGVPTWLKNLGDSEQVKRLIKQIMAGAEDPRQKKVQQIKQIAWNRMLDNIQNYTQARLSLNIPFDESRSPLMARIDDIGRNADFLEGDPEHVMSRLAELDAEFYRLMNERPEDATNNLDEIFVTVGEKLQTKFSEYRLKAEADRVVTGAQTKAETIMTRELMREKFIETMGLPSDRVDDLMELEDGNAAWYSRITGETTDQYYAKYWSDITNKPGGTLQQGTFFPTLSPEKMADYARSLVRAGDQELRWAVQGEESPEARRQLLDAAHKLDPAMAERVAQQTKDMLFQEAKGGISWTDNGKAIIHALENSDISTALHESAHEWRKIVSDVATRTQNAEVLADLKTLEDWAGVKNSEWLPEHEEKFSRAFERYLAEGEAPTPKLVKVFENFKNWLIEIYQAITGSPIDVKITPDVRAVFDRLLGQEPAETKKSRPSPGTAPEVPTTERVAAQENILGDLGTNEGPTMLFQNADPRMPFGGYDELAGNKPESNVMDEGWDKYVRPILQAMEDEAIRRNNDAPLNVGGADDATQAALAKYLNQTYKEQPAAKLQTIRWGESQRDFALLNYNRRYGIDKMADLVWPYQFWTSRSMINWAHRALDKPGLMAFYSRLRMAQKRYERNIPERLRGKIGIPVPFLPEWMGNTLYIDPMRYINPVEQLLRPFETINKDKNYQVQDAERILQEWATDGTITMEQATEAAQTQSGSEWDEAIAEAKLNRQSEISNPFDFMDVMLGKAWYLTTPYKALTGRANEISPTPLTNTANAAQAVMQGTFAQPVGDLIGMFAKPEEWARKKLGIPLQGEYGDYYIDRQLSNMAGDGEISAQDAILAMTERSGAAYDAALQRVRLELAMKVPGAATLYGLLHGAPVQQIAASIPVSTFGAGILPAGELKFRGLYEKWSEAWDKYNAGDTTAINNFFDQYPEYEAYLARKKDPQARLRSFLIGQVWDTYLALDKGNKRMVRAQMGNLFNDAFLDSNTQDYDALDIDTLAMWTRYLGGLVPKTEQTQNVTNVPQLQINTPTMLPQTIDVQLKAYEAERDSRFAGIHDIQSMYYSLPEGKRDSFLLNYPEYSQYRDWRKEYIASHPDLRPFIDSYYAQDILSGTVDASQETRELLKLYYSEDYKDSLYGANDYLKDASSVLWEQLFDYKLLHERLSNAAMTELRLLWETAGKPGGDLNTFLNEIILPTLGQ